ncbi:MAG: MBOAT family protein, partial [bacterium]|nr:MBOAT family protein [bacterium]
MPFISINYLFFFLAVVLLHSLTPYKYRWITLLTASYYFYYCWEPYYSIILAVSTTIDYVCALKIYKSPPKKEKRYFLLLALATNLGLLFFFKYVDFFNSSLQSTLSFFNISYTSSNLNLIAPIGISYFIFKKISYSVDVYREQVLPAKHIGKFALYISFFPQITAGPIDRAKHLLPQFDAIHQFDYSRITGGLKLIAWGMFKKVVIADRLTLLVNSVYTNPQLHNGSSLIAATLLFSIQIYADFSGYSDMAIGFAQILGYNLSDNFNRPYFAVSITEFWRRWHISLTTWLRDYLFLPIAYSVSRKIKTPRLLNIKAESWCYFTGMLSTMLLCGLWHGAKWTFVLWGGFHGLLLYISFATKKIRKKWRKSIPKKIVPLYKIFRILFTFLWVSFAWIFFRADSIADALYIISHLTDNSKTSSLSFINLDTDLLIALAAIAFMLLFHLFQPHDNIRSMLNGKPLLLRWFLYILIVMSILNLG